MGTTGVEGILLDSQNHQKLKPNTRFCRHLITRTIGSDSDIVNNMLNSYQDRTFIFISGLLFKIYSPALPEMNTAIALQQGYFHTN